MKNKITVTISGQDYNMVAAEDAAYVRRCAEFVDGQIRQVTSGSRLALADAAVLAAMNMTNVNVQLLTIQAARTRRKEDIYRAAMLDPHTAAELSIDDIIAMCDELIEAHGPYMAMYR